MVTGVVRGTYEDDDEELEIVLRLKEAVKQSREQYYDLVRAFNPGASDEPAPQPAPDAGTSSAALGKRKAEETEAPARYAPQRREQSPHRSPATFAAPLPKQSASEERSGLHAQDQQDATAASTQQQLLQLLQALQGQAAGDTRSAASPMDAPALSAAGARINEVLSQLTPAMPSVPLPASADSRRNSRRDSVIATSPMTQMTPGYGEDELRATSAEAEAPPINETAAAKKRRVAAETKAATQKALREARACYNCGIRGLRSWRFVHLPQGLDAVLYKDGSDVRETERGASVDKPQWRACNACGKYFTKTGMNRPQERVLGDLQGGPRGAAWRAAVAQNGPKLSEDSDEGETEQAAEGLGIKRARSAGLPRTLSDVCERDSKRVNAGAASAASRGAGPKMAETLEEARLKDFLKDSDGRWRTKRSILENPQGLPPGRPKGCKTGEAKGRSAQRQRLAVARKAEERASSRDGSANRSAMTASSPNTSMSATFAHSVPQSSPVRPSLAARAVTDGWALQQQHRSPAGFSRPQAWMPTPRGRYGAPSYLLDSSPGTALQTLLSEGNDDWSNMAGQPPPTPLRRSPRKNPHGTRATYNPFASDQIEPHSSPTRGDHNQAARSGHDMTLDSADLMNMISTSPLTRGRVRSGNYELAAPPGTHPALWSSDGPSSANKASSDATSPDSCPGSPSPSRKSRRLPRGVMSDAAQPGAHTVSLNQVRLNSNAWDNALGAGATPTDGGRTPADNAGEPTSRRTHGRSPSQDRKAARQARAGHGGPGSSHMGPFMGTEGFDDAEMDDGGPCGSPTLGRATRRRRPAAGASLYGAGARTSDALGPASSPPMFSEADLGEMDEWGRTASMKEFFPTPSPVKAWTLGESPDMATPADTKPAAGAAAPQQVPTPQPPVIHVSNAPGTSDGAQPSTALVSQKNTPAAAPTPVNSLTPAAAASAVKRVGRRPLPATVEDAPSTSSASSPPEALSPDGEYEDAQSLFDMFDDPYGLLANSGLGANGNMQGISLETFDGGIELHPSFNFMQHLQQFTHEGSTGVAASVATGAVVTSAAPAAPAAASPSSPPRRSPISNGAAPATPSKKTTAALSAAAAAAQRGELSPGLNALLNSFSAAASSSMGDPAAFALPNFSPSQFNFDEQTMKSMFASMVASSSPPRPLSQQRAAITATDESAPEQGSSAS
jgi:hypothetical protein